MQSHDPIPDPEHGRAGQPGMEPSAGAGLRLSPGVPRGHAWLWAAAAALLAGFLSWVGQEKAYGHFKPQFQLPANFARMSPYEKTDVIADLTQKATPAAEQKNSVLAYGLLGAALAGALGL